MKKITCPFCGEDVWLVPIFMPEEGKSVIGFNLERAHFCEEKRSRFTMTTDIV